MRMFTILCALGATASACATEDDVSTSNTQQALGCPEPDCLLNAASVGDGLYFHELDQFGGVNSAGVRIDSFHLATGTPVAPRVIGAELYGMDAGGALYGGSRLLNAYFILAHGVDHYRVRISSIDQLSYWVGNPGDLRGYTFVYQKLVVAEQKEQPMCTTHDVEAGVPQVSAVVFIGDRYDAPRKLVMPSTGGWFNVACMGSASAKMHLLRHTAAGSDATHMTNMSQRTAMLKMLTDDICGTGHSFTQDGEYVFYADQRSWHPLPTDPVLYPIASYESIWSDRGAICLNEPRRLKEDGPGLWLSIKAECMLPPSCSGMLGAWWTYGYGVTANPALPAPP
jgi:hypothetical protein